MPGWAQLVWCGLLILLRYPPRWLGTRGAVTLIAILGIPLRLWAVLRTVTTLWMLIGIAWVAVGAFYALTAFWIVFLWLLFRGRHAAAARIAPWMAGLAVLEGAAYLNLAAGALIGVFLSARVEPLFRPLIGITYAVAQVVCLRTFARNEA